MAKATIASRRAVRAADARSTSAYGVEPVAWVQAVERQQSLGVDERPRLRRQLADLGLAPCRRCATTAAYDAPAGRLGASTACCGVIDPTSYATVRATDPASVHRADRSAPTAVAAVATRCRAASEPKLEPGRSTAAATSRGTSTTKMKASDSRSRRLTAHLRPPHRCHPCVTRCSHNVAPALNHVCPPGR